jgi:2-keto-4-pentenoate hydratase
MSAAPSRDANELAARLRRAEETHVPVAPFFQSGETDLSLAYEIQRQNIRHWVGSGRRMVGRKIGLTDPDAQRRFGLSEPICGALFSDILVADGSTVAANSVMTPKVEPEVAILLGRDLSADPKREDISAAIRSMMPAIEIVGTRFPAGAASIADDVADNCGYGLVVVGPPLACALVEIDGTGVMTLTRERGSSVVEANPNPERILASLAWLAGKAAHDDAPLRAGDLIMTGALAAEQPVSAGTRAAVAFGDNAPATVSFEREGIA